MKTRLRNSLCLFWAFALLLTSAFGCTVGGDPLVPAKTLLYILDSFNKAVFVVENITTVNGAVDPARTIQGGNTLLEDPKAIAVDGKRDVLYVADANQQAILVFAPASQKNGDVSPSRQLPTAGTPTAMSLDDVHNRLYVFNATDQTVQLWNNASTRDGDVPDNTFTLGYAASSIFIDSERDFLYVGEPLAFTINVYNQASTLINTPTPTRMIMDDDAPLDNLNSITMNIPNDLLFMSNTAGPLINVFNMASALNGEVDPNRILEGDLTELSDDPRTLKLKFLENTLYVTNTTTQVAVWDTANTVDGNVAPNRLITVNGATTLIGFDIDLLH